MPPYIPLQRFGALRSDTTTGNERAPGSVPGISLGKRADLGSKLLSGQFGRGRAAGGGRGGYGEIQKCCVERPERSVIAQGW